MSPALQKAKDESLAMGRALRAAKEAFGTEAYTDVMLALGRIDVALNHASRPPEDQTAPRIFAFITGPETDRKCLAANDHTFAHTEP